MLKFTACQSVKKTFREEVNTLIPFADTTGVLTESEMVQLPQPVAEYLRHNGFVSKPHIMSAEVVYSESAIRFKPGEKMTRLTTIQYNRVDTPVRVVYMRAMYAGIIPFEGRDLYQDGKGHMRGILAKCISVFDDTSREVSQSALITLFSEAMIVPGYLFSPYLEWEASGDNWASGVFRHKGMEVRGTFYFNENYEFVRFETLDRYMSSDNGKSVQYPWYVEASAYRAGANGIRFPTCVRVVWQLPEGDFEYWKGNIATLRYNPRPSVP